MSRTALSKAAIKALEKVFVAEVNGRLPFQSRARIFRKLCDAGFLAPMEKTYGGRFPATVAGYTLTHAGRYAYCSICGEIWERY